MSSRNNPARVAIVMEMNFDFAEPGLRELGEAIEKVGAIFFAGEEPTVTRRPPVRVAKLPQVGIALGPGVDARAPGRVVGVTVERLVVIAEREQQVCVTARSWRPGSAHQVACVVRKPLMEVLVA